MARPKFTLKAHGIEVAVWENKSDRDDKTFFNMTVQRSYFDKDTNDWKRTNSLSPRDALVAAALLQEATKQVSVRTYSDDTSRESVASGDDNDAPF